MATIRSTYNAGAEQFQEGVNVINDLNKSYKDITTSEKELLDLSKQLQNSLRNINESMVLRSNESRTVVAIEKELKNLNESYKKQLKEVDNLERKISNELDKQRNKRNISINQINIHNKIQEEASLNLIHSQDRILDLNYEINEAKKYNDTDEIRRLQRLREAERAQEKGFKDNLKYAEKILKENQKEKDLANEKIKLLNQTKIYNTENLRDLNKEINSLEKIKLLTEAREKIDKAKSFLLNKWVGFLGLIGLKNLVQILFAADKQVVDLAENLGIARESAQVIRTEFLQFVTTVKDGSLSVTDMFEAQANLTKELGLAVRYSDKELKTFNDLTKLIGVSVSSAAKLNILSASTGIEYEKYVQNILEGAFQNEKQLEIQMSSKDILEEIGKLSAGILIKFQNNPEALGKAVIQAKALGSSLEQVDKIGESLLNWESSIESTLKAELLTGKQLNLERARAASLTGDQADLMKEISSQIGSTKDFMKLNVLAQRSLAEAFGLSKDELAEMLMKQDLVNKYGDQARELTKQQAEEFQKSGKSLGQFLEDQSKQLELQQKLNNSIDKMKQLFVILAQGPFGKIVNMMVSIMNNAAVLKTTFGLIAGVIAGKLVSGLANSIIQMRALLAVTEAKTILDIIGSSVTTGGVALITGGAAAAATIAYMHSQMNQAQKVSDGVALSNRGPFSITDRYGATAITTNGDGIAVSPNISRGGSSNKELERKLDELITINRQQYEVAKSGNVIQINEFALGKAAPIANSKENSRNFY